MTQKQFKGLVFGIPREIMPGERRVAAIPDTVKKMVVGGAQVLIEKGAGLKAYISDEDYIAAGAEIVEDSKTVYDRSNIILKVKEPLFNEDKQMHEVDMMHEGQLLITFLHPAAPANHEMVKKLTEKK